MSYLALDYRGLYYQTSPNIQSPNLLQPGGAYVVIIMNYTNSLFTEKRSYVTLSSSQATCQLVNLKRDFS